MLEQPRRSFTNQHRHVQVPPLSDASRKFSEEESTVAMVPPVVKLTAPQEAMMALHNTGVTRGDRPSSQIFFSSVLGGSLLSVGGSLYCLIGGGSTELLVFSPAMFSIATALLFPIGLSSIVLSGSDLLTSNMLYSTLPFLSGETSRTNEEKLQSLVKLWMVSFAGNLAASVSVAFIVSQGFAGTALATFAQQVAIKKVSGTALATFTKAVGANWLVNVAVFQAACASTAPGKIVVLWLPITAFVALGLEHSVANMFLIPLGIFSGADISVTEMVVNNLMPVIAGNAIGATVFVGGLYWHALGMPAAFKNKK